MLAECECYKSLKFSKISDAPENFLDVADIFLILKQIELI